MKYRKGYILIESVITLSVIMILASIIYSIVHLSINIKLNIEGMHCTGCSTRLEKVLNNVDGVEDAKVSLEEKNADIKYDETQVSEKELIEAVEDAGFKAN